ncbi:transporter substrate-binding domain-containing protein [Hungatella sp.]|uniref:ATP-binding protein n=1 Tax=Hungatella sp. TaxID=2613924 RepID=UPI002A7FA0FA|nr:transporter substrate-binding domain-containing protein [Hungatella sp.]
MMKRASVVKRFGLWAAVSLVIMMMSVLCITSMAAESQPRVLRVAFCEAKGITEKDPDGSRHGLVMDYLNEIAKYTGWAYEFIDTTPDAMLKGFAEGEYELMGGNYYLPGLEAYYAYPDYNIGYSKSVIFARENDDSVQSHNLKSLNGKTIGVYDRAVENVRRLKEYLSMNDLDCTLKYYSYEQLMDGNLYPYLQEGDVDLLLGNSVEHKQGIRAVVSYDSQPYYIVTNVGNQEVLDGLNMAMAKIADSNPDFASERYAANFLNASSVDIRLTKEEKDYIRQKGSVTVAMPHNFHPLTCEDPDDMHDGLTYDILKEVTEFTGLEFNYVSTDSYIKAMDLVRQGKADILGFYLGDEADSVKQKMVLTAPFASMNSIIVRNKTSGFPGSELVGAVIEGRELPKSIRAAEVKSYRNINEALKAVNRGEADFAYGLATYMEHEIQKSHFANVVPVTLINDRMDICLAMARPADPELLTIMNKAINSIPSGRSAELLDHNMVSAGTGVLSITELIYANPMMFVGILTAILLILVTVVLWVNRVRVKAAVMQSELKKAEAESRAKGEFLSRMSHELRTPMNAVVGLADLAGMTEGVPENIREMLVKLRASSHYLLDLINDILDMSRLDSGMLTIASEPFFLERMLNELRTMMETDANRRGLNYRIETNISHGGVTGDVIRLRQVLTNLLSNAFKFTPEGGSVILRVTEKPDPGEYAAGKPAVGERAVGEYAAGERAVGESAAGERADGEHVVCENASCGSVVYEFQVIDTGVGIDLKDQTRIFDTFEQVGTNYAKSQGTGLGLPISRSIVRLMGGELRVKSEPGHGSEFYFTLTLPVGSPVYDGGSVNETHVKEEMLKEVRILLAEDNDLNAEIAIQLLELKGAVVSRSENGRLAVERFKESDPGEFQVILMDIQMPEMNGLEATRAIRAMDRPDAAAIPIIAMTANVFKEDVDAAMEAGMSGFEGKPLDVEHLYLQICRLLGLEAGGLKSK